MEEKQIQSLVKEAQAGNADAFGQLYDTYSQPLYNFLYSKLAHRPTCEDLLHTVFLKAWNNLHRYQPRPNAKFSTWLYQIANYTLIDHWRVKKETVDIDKVDNLSAFSVEPEKYEDYKFLYEAMRNLPPDYQTVLDLKFRQDLDVAEIAEIMNKSTVGIRVLQHRALKALKKILNGRYDIF